MSEEKKLFILPKDEKEPEYLPNINIDGVSDNRMTKFDRAYDLLKLILSKEGSDQNVFLMNNYAVYAELEVRGYYWDTEAKNWVKLETRWHV